MKKLMLASLVSALFTVNAHALMMVIPAEISVTISEKNALTFSQLLDVEPREEIISDTYVKTKKAMDIKIDDRHSIGVYCVHSVSVKKDGSEFEDTSCNVSVRKSVYDLKQINLNGGIKLTDRLAGEPAKKIFDVLKIKGITNKLGATTKTFKASNNQLLLECSVAKNSTYNCNIEMQAEQAPSVLHINL